PSNYAPPPLRDALPICYAGVCPAWAEADFLAGYADGRVVHDARQYVERARSEISRQEHRIRQLRKDTDRTRERIGRDGISAEDRDRKSTRLNSSHVKIS